MTRVLFYSSILPPTVRPAQPGLLQGRLRGPEEAPARPGGQAHQRAEAAGALPEEPRLQLEG